MKLFICLMASVSILGSCANSNLNRIAQVSDYHVRDNQYVVVVPASGVSMSQAKKMARQRAAEMTVAQGARYFTIDSEQQVTMSSADQDLDQYNWGSNQYQEQIVEKGYGRDQLQNPNSTSMTTSRGVKLVFTIHLEKPIGRSIDACTLTDCGS